MYCKQCGQAVPEDAIFCPKCGCAVAPGAGYRQDGYGHGMFRPRNQRRLAGVCAAFALRYGWNLTAARILMVLLGIFLFPLAEIT